MDTLAKPWFLILFAAVMFFVFLSMSKKSR